MDPWYLAGLFFLTFLSEDAAVLTGGVLASTDMLSAWPVFLVCFLGIWAGDLGLYFLARWFGRPVINRLWGNRGRTAEKMTLSEDWFRQRGLFALVLCRVIPGTRLPTYLAAGLLRMPAPSFSVVTGVLAAIWVGGAFWLTHQLGKAAPDAFQILRQNAAWAGAAVLLVFVAISFREKIAASLRRAPWLQRWLQWEFWPSWLFYLPVAFQYLRLALKYRGFNLPTCANPGMFTGGLIGESKFFTLQDLQETSPEWVAPSHLLPEGPGRFFRLGEILETGGLEFPFVLKPDVAQRGSGFKVARTPADAQSYLEAVNVSVVAQKYIPGPHEAGVFYYRFPDEPCGRIFAITEKIFPVIFGDGHRTVEELIRADARASLMAGTYLRRFQSRKNEVLPFGKNLRLVEAGNHAQGCIFRDGWHLWSEQLEARFDEISRGLSGFYIGRYDVRFSSAEDFQRGRGFSILELNGAASEATSAYDATKSLGAAYRLLFEQWELVFAIASENRRRGCRADSWRVLLSEWRRYQSRSLCHPLAD